MDTLPPRDQENNTPKKRCTGPCERLLPATTEYFHRNGPYGLYGLCKVCKNQKTKARNSRPEVREQNSARYHTYWQSYKERDEARARISEYQQAYRQVPENREQKIEYLRSYSKRPEAQKRRREWSQAYREVPGIRERDNEGERIRYRQSPVKREQARTKVNNRVARRKNAPGSHTLEQIKEQYDRQKGNCYYCQRKVTWRERHVDHVIPLSRGGSNDISNLVIACATCNLSKGNKLPHEWTKGGRLL